MSDTIVVHRSVPVTTVDGGAVSWWHALVVGTGGLQPTRHHNPAGCQTVNVSAMETTPVRTTLNL
jgi:hypothetical protein